MNIGTKIAIYSGMNNDKNQMLKFIFRSNSRRKQEFGVHSSAIKSMSPNGGESNLRYLSVDARKGLIKDNIECLKLMQSEKFKDHLQKMRIQVVEYYKKIKG